MGELVNLCVPQFHPQKKEWSESVVQLSGMNEFTEMFLEPESPLPPNLYFSAHFLHPPSSGRAGMGAGAREAELHLGCGSTLQARFALTSALVLQ